jgi:hypothetical protein
MQSTNPKTSPFRLIVLFDTSVGSGNIGDQIIMDSVNGIVDEIFPDAMVIRVPTTLPLGFNGKKLLRDADLAVIGGTNLLSSHMLRYRQWKIDPIDAYLMKDAVLLGVGWWQYQQSPDVFTRTMLRNALSSRYIHAVRDTYTAVNLGKTGVTKVTNTGCPTLWSLSAARLDNAARNPVDVAVTTVTDYHPNVERDNRMLAGIRSRYSKRYLWLQGIRDYEYVKQLDVSGFELVEPTLRAFDQILDSPCEYAGTRLHAGIRALQRGRFARIVPIDNRAREMGKDFGVPLIEDLSEAGFEAAFGEGRAIDLRLPVERIAQWKAQFAATDE